eukprot:1170797-Pyramimonas_sp.AAC.1
MVLGCARDIPDRLEAGSHRIRRKRRGRKNEEKDKRGGRGGAKGLLIRTSPTTYLSLACRGVLRQPPLLNGLNGWINTTSTAKDQRREEDKGNLAHEGGAEEKTPDVLQC